MRFVRLLFFLMAALFGADALYIYSLTPDWTQLANGTIAKSRYILDYEQQRAADPRLPPLRWSPTALKNIPAIVRRAVIVAEDSRFYQHEGVDIEALQAAIEKNIERGEMVYGASTISQQTVKNLFLSPSRNPLRKWHELVLTTLMEQALSKERILEIYLNIAEFGPGLYGVDAATQYYWQHRVQAITTDQAVELAAALPAPKQHNPRSRSRFFLRHKKTIARHLGLAQAG